MNYEKKLAILNNIEKNRSSYEIVGNYENHKPILCMFTDKKIVHVYNEITEKDKYSIGWAVNVELSNGEIISCIASNDSYDENDIDENDNFIIGGK